ncbi:hypothetical protein BOVA115_4515 [Bacteroides ovatus]|nr:hypothetical protein BOVA115_4515 [Bacteroides ovatus]
MELKYLTNGFFLVFFNKQFTLHLAPILFIHRRYRVKG